MPAAWILAGILSAATVALRTGAPLRPHPRLFALTRSTIGLIAVAPLLTADPRQLLDYVLPGIAVGILTVGVACVGAWWLERRAGLDRDTGTLSLLSGGASLLPALAQQLGADYRYVALVQYLRLLTVSLSVPVVAALWVGTGTGARAASTPPPVTWTSGLLMVAILLLGPGVGRILRVPAPGIFGPMLLAVAVGTLWPTEVVLDPPQVVRTAAFLMVGWMAGGGLTAESLRQFRQHLPQVMAWIAILIGACAVAAAGLAWWVEVSFFEAYLATTPGGVETVLAVAAESDAGPVVVAVQIIRLVMVLSVAAVLPRLLRR